MFVIQITGLATGASSPADGEYLTGYDPDAHAGLGYFATSPDLADAMRFDTAREAIALWRARSTVRPNRPDGRPNRPLTALSVWIAQETEVPL